MSVDTYIKEAINNIELQIAKSGRQLLNTAKSPIKLKYRPELYVSPVLQDKQANYYHTTVGQLRRAVELRRIDINLEITLLSCYLDQPRHGHLDEVSYTFSYLK